MFHVPVADQCVNGVIIDEHIRGIVCPFGFLEVRFVFKSIQTSIGISCEEMEVVVTRMPAQRAFL